VARFAVDPREATTVAIVLIAGFDAAGRWWVEQRRPRALLESLCINLAKGMLSTRRWRPRPAGQ